MTKTFYNLFTYFYPLVIWLYAPFNKKAQAWLSGRSNIFQQLSKSINKKEKIVWMHCASLGEFEQGRPVLEEIKRRFPHNYKILLTFFSPSGYEAAKHYKGADYLFYLPMDSQKSARLFLEVVQPRLMLFVKYEFWYYYITEAKLRNIPLVLVSGIFRHDQPFFKWYGTLHRRMLNSFTSFFVQNQQSAALLEQLGYTKNVQVSGDTRFDRVILIAQQFEPIQAITDFCGSSPVVVAGSTWSEDDKKLNHFANTQPATKFIIAPHNIDQHRINECLHLYKCSVTYSSMKNTAIPPHINTLILDNIGMLSRLYKYGTVCYVGGGFGADGVHNVLEPAVYGLPVVFGPEYKKFVEAADLVEGGGAVSVSNTLNLENELKKLLLKDEQYVRACKAARDYVYSHAGSTKKIVDYIQEKRLLTS